MINKSFARKLGVAFALLVLIAFICQSACACRAILMIGDGMGFKHVEMARNYKGSELAMETLPVKLAVSTYPYGGSYDPEKAWSDFEYVKNGATDSSAAATALSTGVKTNKGNTATDISKKNRLKTMSEIAAQNLVPLASGVVTTVPFSHATPACFVAHNESRDNYFAIAREMITSFGDGKGALGNTPTIEVIIGGGHPDWAKGYISIEEYEALKNGATGQGWTFVERKPGVNGAEALANAASRAKKLFGLFGGPGGVMEYRLANGSGANPENPPLAVMATAALNVLEKHKREKDGDKHGFFLMIEGGSIDKASHDNNADRLIGEMLDFDEAVAAVIKWINEKDPAWEETLLIVTADHETGYISREKGKFPDSPLQNPGVGIVPVAGLHFDWNSGGHTNCLVPLYAKGAYASELSKLAENTDPVRGAYLDNTQVFEALKNFIASAKPKESASQPAN